MSVIVDSKGHGKKLFIKGAPESILERCSHFKYSSTGKSTPLTNAIKNSILEKLADWADAEALRVLALAVVDGVSVPKKLEPSMYASLEVLLSFF